MLLLLLLLPPPPPLLLLPLLLLPLLPLPLLLLLLLPLLLLQVGQHIEENTKPMITEIFEDLQMDGAEREAKEEKRIASKAKAEAIERGSAVALTIGSGAAAVAPGDVELTPAAEWQARETLSPAGKAGAAVTFYSQQLAADAAAKKNRWWRHPHLASRPHRPPSPTLTHARPLATLRWATKLADLIGDGFAQGGDSAVKKLQARWRGKEARRVSRRAGSWEVSSSNLSRNSDRSVRHSRYEEGNW